MRRFFRLIAMLVAAALLLAACAAGSSSGTTDPLQNPSVSGVDQQPAAGAEVALVTTDTRLETAFGQLAWNAIVHFTGEAGLTGTTYKAEEDDPDAATSTLELAVRGGAQIIVTMGASLNTAAAEMFTQYPEVCFVLLNAAENIDLAGNAVGISFSAAQAGWLAGFLAVYEAAGAPVALAGTGALRSRQYMGGFLLGAQAAAEERGVEPAGVMVLLAELTDEIDEDEQRELLDTAFDEGAVLLFCTDSTVQELALAATGAAGARMMGLSLTLDTTRVALASVEHDPKALLADVLGQWRNGRFPGGQRIVGTIAAGDVTLKAELARFENVGERRYADAVDRFANGLVGATLNVLLKPDANGALPDFHTLPLDRLVLIVAGAGDEADAGNVAQPAG